MTTRPPTNRDHEYAFKSIAITWLIITAFWTAYVVQTQMSVVADEVRQMRVAK